MATGNGGASEPPGTAIVAIVTIRALADGTYTWETNMPNWQTLGLLEAVTAIIRQREMDTDTRRRPGGA